MSYEFSKLQQTKFTIYQSSSAVDDDQKVQREVSDSTNLAPVILGILITQLFQTAPIRTVASRSFDEVDVEDPLLQFLVEVALLIGRPGAHVPIVGILRGANRRNVDGLARHAHSIAVQTTFGPKICFSIPLVRMALQNRIEQRNSYSNVTLQGFHFGISLSQCGYPNLSVIQSGTFF